MVVTTIAGGIAAAAALSYAGYATMAPKSQLYGRTFLGEGRGSRRLALTYDDGPNDPWTPKLLDVLAKHGVKATFFMIGRFVEERPEIARAVADAGHVIGNHTMVHPNLIFVGRTGIQEELLQCATMLAAAVGKHSNLFRPPFGGRRPAVLREVRRQGMVPVMWTVTCYDWKRTTADRVERHALRQVRGGNIILLHDGGHLRFGADRSHTVEATDRLIRRYKDQGYEFVTVPEMMESRVAGR
jgi:peptidoglycan/xylan/chitin deacetylase (PgdA/CDA1 family)